MRKYEETFCDIEQYLKWKNKFYKQLICRKKMLYTSLHVPKTEK
jgi:hypothetical protein